MKILNKADSKEIESFFAQVIGADDIVVIWQFNPNKNRRVIYNTLLNNVSFENETMSFVLVPESSNEKLEVLPTDLYFYIENRQAIFKSEYISTQANYLTVTVPNEIRLLDESNEQDEQTLKSVRKNIGKDRLSKSARMVLNSKTEHIQTKMIVKFKSQSDQLLFEKELEYISPDEEDRIFAVHREAPRARAHKGKKIVIARRTRSDYIEKFELYDLSRGGFAYVVNLEIHFTAGDIINVVGFDHEEFENPMIAKVMGVRPLDELGTQHKVGCKFLDEDEIDALLEKEKN